MIGNSLTFIGRLTRDIELKKTSSDKIYCRFTLARNRGLKADSGTVFLDFVAYDKAAELLANYVKKGQKVAIQGYMIDNHWKDNDGNSRVSYSCVVEGVEFINVRDDSVSVDSKDENTKSANNEVADDEDNDLPF